MAATDSVVVACASRFTVTMLPVGANWAWGDSGRSTCPKIISNAARMGIGSFLGLPESRAIAQRDMAHTKGCAIRQVAIAKRRRHRAATTPSRNDAATAERPYASR